MLSLLLLVLPLLLHDTVYLVLFLVRLLLYFCFFDRSWLHWTVANIPGVDLKTGDLSKGSEVSSITCFLNLRVETFYGKKSFLR